MWLLQAVSAYQHNRTETSLTCENLLTDLLKLARGFASLARVLPLLAARLLLGRPRAFRYHAKISWSEISVIRNLKIGSDFFQLVDNGVLHGVSKRRSGVCL